MTPTHSPTAPLFSIWRLALLLYLTLEKQSHREVRNSLPVTQQVGVRAAVGTPLYLTSKPLSLGLTTPIYSLFCPRIDSSSGMLLGGLPDQSLPPPL